MKEVLETKFGHRLECNMSILSLHMYMFRKLYTDILLVSGVPTHLKSGSYEMVIARVQASRAVVRSQPTVLGNQSDTHYEKQEMYMYVDVFISQVGSCVHQIF